VRARLFSVAILFFGISGWAQQTPGLLPNQPASAIIPTVTFTRNWDAAQPSFFKVEVESSGRASYTSQQAGPQEPYMQKFTLTDPTRQRIFDLAEKTNYFNGNFDFTQHKIAFTGQKTLIYHDAAHSGQTTYNWSRNQDIEQLTDIFVAIANTVEAGRKLDYLIHYDKLGLDQQLEAMEREADSKQMIELRLIAPELQEIAQNPVYMHIAQERARHLLRLGGR
jgi:hypothetical protein